jgi:rhodanese-related sulfurtransferase
MEEKGKHMKELLKTKRITIGVFAFVLIIIIGFLTLKEPKNNYKITPIEMVEDLPLIYQVTPDEAMELMYDTATVFVDIRSINDFEKGHLENAINIPVPNLLLKENTDLFDQWFKDSIIVVLYGNDELQANAPWMLMYELGYTNTRTLMGGCVYIDKLYDDGLAENETFFVEDPAYDFAGIVNKASEQSGTPAVEKKEKKKVVVRKKKKKEAEGGC